MGILKTTVLYKSMGILKTTALYTFKVVCELKFSKAATKKKVKRISPKHTIRFSVYYFDNFYLATCGPYHEKVSFIPHWRPTYTERM